MGGGGQGGRSDSVTGGGAERESIVSGPQRSLVSPGSGKDCHVMSSSSLKWAHGCHGG